MKKILLGLITIFTFSTVFAHGSAHLFDDASLGDDVVSIYDLDTNLNRFQDDTFKISPNPSKNKLNIKLPKASENMTLEVFDVLGKRIHKSTITQLSASVDVSNWKTGVYLVKVSNENESQTKRFIKQ
ncbi:T9SS type A sorting domain-containing protein [Winogradskyella eximia]|uniref:T9SS type A sorting domain-containing protein n=1 Tax=Winogradskyella eximia TaxID=262006 RepID=UPI0024909FC9|nr:T9SS type A sorting domain-containing protein [Winogradskyella eximia]